MGTVKSKCVEAGAALALVLNSSRGSDQGQLASTALSQPEKHRSRGVAPEPIWP